MQEPESKKKLTGLKVFAMVSAFFGLIISVNLVMAYFAIHTFSGLQTEKPYESGLAYNRAISDAKAQAARGWKVDAHVERMIDGSVNIMASVKDAAAMPLNDLTVQGSLRSPIDSKLDQSVVLVGDGKGSYHGQSRAEAGQWDIDLLVAKEGSTVFHSINRVILH